MKKRTTDVLVSEAGRRTADLRAVQAEMARCGKERRDSWQARNDRGISQRRLAIACGVVEHTVYTELRKRREAAA